MKKLDNTREACDNYFEDHRQSSIEPIGQLYEENKVKANIVDSGPIHATRMRVVCPKTDGII